MAQFEIGGARRIIDGMRIREYLRARKQRKREKALVGLARAQKEAGERAGQDARLKHRGATGGE